MRHRFYITAMLGLSLLMAAPAQAQIALENTPVADAGNDSTGTTFTGFDPLNGTTLVVAISAEQNSGNPSFGDWSATFGGTPLNQINFVQEGVQSASIFWLDGVAANTAADLDVSFANASDFAVSAFSLSGVAGISGSPTFGEPNTNLPFTLNYGGAAGGFVVGSMPDNTFGTTDPADGPIIMGDNITHSGAPNSDYTQRLAGGWTAGASAGHAHAYGTIAANGSYGESFDQGLGGTSSRNAGALVAFYPTTLVNQSLTWSGGISGSPGVWDNFGNMNWNSNADVFQPGDTVTFDDTVGVTTNVVIDGGVAPGNLTVDSDTNNYFFSGGGIGGAGALIKSGTSTLTLDARNSYSGGTTINGGVIELVENAGQTSDGSIGPGDVTLNGGGLHASARASSNVKFINENFIVNDIAGNVISNNSTGAKLLVLNGSFSGTGNVTIENNSGDGVNGVDIFGDNTGFMGSITLGGPDPVFLRLLETVETAGTFVAWDLGTQGTLVTRNLNPSASITLGSLAGSAGSTLGSNGGGQATDVEWRIGSNDNSTTFGGTIEDGSGSVAITKIGTGTLTLTGTNSYTGDTRVEGGTLSVAEPTLADTADVYLTTGATLELDFAPSGGSAGDFDNSAFVDGADFILWQQNTGVGSLTDWEADYGTGGGTPTVDTIDQLFIDGVAQATGTWGAIGSGAANETALISGLGWLNVTTTAVANTAAVPEPCAALLCVGFALSLGLRRNRS